MGRNKEKPDDSFNSSTTIQCCCFIQFILLGLETFTVLKNKVIKINLKWTGNSKDSKGKNIDRHKYFFLCRQHESVCSNASCKNSGHQKPLSATMLFGLRILVKGLLTLLFSRQFYLGNDGFFRSRHLVSRCEKDWHRYFDGLGNSTRPFLIQSPSVWNWTDSCTQHLFLSWNKD